MSTTENKSSIHTEPYRKHLGFWSRLMCRLGMCGGHVDHAKDGDGIWWVGLRCATCGTLKCPLKSKHQDKETRK